MEDFIPMLAGLMIIGVGVVLLLPATIALLVVFMQRTAQVAELSARVGKLESVVRRQPAPVREAEAKEPVTVLPSGPARAQGKARPAEAEHVESWIGRRALGWIAVGLLLFAVAFFLKHAFENDWIGEQVRVAIGIVIGAALCVAGVGFHWRGWHRYSQMLSGGGVAILYLTTYAAFGYYHLLVREWAAVFLILIIVQSEALAVLYDAPAIAIMGIIGGLLNPILLATDVDQYPAFFAYLAILNAGAVGLTILRAWPALATIALVGTQALFWSWYVQHFEPEKMWAAVLFQGVVLTLFLAQTIGAQLLRRWSASVEDLARALLNVFLFTFAAWWLLDAEYHAWLGLATLGLAAIYAVLTWIMVSWRGDDRRLGYTLIAATAALVATVFPLQTEASWITLGWAVEGLALWWFGLRSRMVALRCFGAVLLGLAGCRLALVDTPFAHAEPFVPFLNAYGLPALAVAACVLLAALAARHYREVLGQFDQAARWAAGLGGLALLWLVLSTEGYQYFTTQIDPSLESTVLQGDRWVNAKGQPVDETRIDEPEHLRRLGQTSLSIVWAAYAALVLAAGFLLRNTTLRGVALGLFALTLLKVVLIDMESLPGLYRVAAFFGLAVVLGLAAWWYQKLGAGAHAPKEGKVASHEAA